MIMRKKSFFDTKEYNYLRKIVDRLKEKQTLRNYVLFLKIYNDALELVNIEYNKIGWSKERGNFAWAWDFHRNRAKKEFNSSELSYIFKKYWPMNSDPDFDGMLKELKIKEKG